jgi:hypothetical protein
MRSQGLARLKLTPRLPVPGSDHMGFAPQYHSSHQVDQDEVNNFHVSWHFMGIPASCGAGQRERSLVLAIAMQLHNTAYPEAGPTRGRSATVHVGAGSRGTLRPARRSLSSRM